MSKRSFLLRDILKGGGNDNDNGSPSAPKRSFRIEDILEDQPEGNGNPRTPYPFRIEDILEDQPSTSNCLQVDLVSVEKNIKFRLDREIFKVSILNIAQCEDPEKTLFDEIKRLINFVLSKRMHVTKVGVTLESTALEKGNIEIPFTEPSRDISQLLKNQLFKLDQSAKLVPLFNSQIYVSITTYSKPLGRGKVRDRKIMGKIQTENLIDVDFEDNMCFFHSIVASMSYVMSRGNDSRQKSHSRIYNNLEKYKDQLQAKANELRSAAKIPSNNDGYGIDDAKSLQEYFNSVYGTKYCILIFSTCSYTVPRFKGNVENPDFYLPLLLFENHFFAIKNLGKFCNGGRNCRKYCVPCKKTFRKNEEHRNNCPRRCSYCLRYGKDFPCTTSASVTCKNCCRVFPNEDCFKHHEKSFCGKFIFCEKCFQTYRREPKFPHVCGDTFCTKCNTYHSKNNSCYIESCALSKLQDYRFIVFDFETRQDSVITEGVFELEVNYIVAYVFCTKCLKNDDFLEDNDCEICGPKKRNFFSGIEDEHCLANFVNWVIYEQNPKYKSIALSHYGGKFDNVFVLKKLFNMNLNPKCTKNGNKFYEIRVEGDGETICDTSFKDTYNFFSVPLSSLVRTFDLQITEKMFFAHLFNRRENYHVHLDHLPPREDYMYSSFTTAKQIIFDEWYAREYNTPFHLPKKLKEYCQNDVDILSHAVKKFRSLFLEEGGLDPFIEATTIASTCMKLYRHFFLPEKTLAIIPENGYQRHSKASEIALKYLTWVGHKTGKAIQHRNTLEGEKKIGDYLVDGFIQDENRVIEVLGCYWHGHIKKCVEPDTMLPKKRTAEAEYFNTMKRINAIRAHGYEVDMVWECEIHEQLKSNNEMAEFFNDCILGGPIDPRDGYFGGRCNPHKIHSVKTPGRKIRYLDFTSLYPSTNLLEYPIGIPEVIDVPFKDQNVKWTNPCDNKYKGLLKVFIVPPKKLLAPVLPLKVDDFLIFPLCKKCTISFQKDNPKGTHKCKQLPLCNKCSQKNNNSKGFPNCTHNDKERGWVTTTTHLELNLALEKGYTVTKFFGAYNFKEWTNSLFSSYVKKFLKIKVMADGWPPNVQTDAQKAQFVREYKELFDVDIDPFKVVRNPGLRYIAKLCLNSLWGRFSLRNTLSKCIVTDDPLELDNIVNNSTLDVVSIDLLNESQVMVVYNVKKPFIVEHNCSNIIISLYTTSAARVTLFRAMDKVINTPYAYMIYTDTDSLLFETLEDVEILQTGNYLGDLTDEVGPNEEIIEVVIGGNKQYGYVLRNKETGELRYILKIRGITLDAKTCTKLHYEKFKKMVLEYSEDDVIDLEYQRLLPSRLGNVRSANIPKRYKVVYKKGHIGSDLIVYPFGYQE